MHREIKFISVVMPTYNCAKYIAQSIQSILNQTFKDFELLIIDDGSTDDTEEIVNQFKDSRIIYHKRKHEGISSALNYGVLESKGEWIARIDADDLNIPERLMIQTEFSKNNPDFNVISSLSIYFNESYKILFFHNPPCQHDEIYKFLNKHNPINHSGLLIEKNILTINKYNETFEVYEDFELFFRIRDRVRFYIIPDYLVFTRIHKGSLTSESSKKKIFSFLYNFSYDKYLCSKNVSEKKYWSNVIASTYLFYGEIKKSRKYLLNSLNFKNFGILLLTLFPDCLIKKLIQQKVKFKISGLIKKKKIYYNFLNQYKDINLTKNAI
jgi:glycosyltransferase involved in cell wall biosynthesis